jgi:SulP family sulfate permease
MSVQHVNAPLPTTQTTSLLDKLRPAWSRQMNGDTLKSDAVAGLTTAIMLVPQGMAYAMLAGLPPIVGLYASTIPLVLYALFGTSRQLAVGPVAMVSLLVAAGVGATAGEGADTATIVGLAALLALMVGVMQTAKGIFRLGFLVNFLGHPVVSGFTSAAALIIGLSQLKHLLGVNIPRSKHIHTILLNAIERIGEVNVPTLLIGVLSIVFLLGAKRYAKRLPAALLVVVVTTLAVWGLGLAGSGVKIVGEVPAGLPGFSLPSLDKAALSALLPTAIAISLVGFMESISVAKAFARKHRYELDANKELIGLGAANLGAAVFGGYPVTGGFSRTAVNDQAGAKTPLAAIITAGLIALTLLLLTPLFHFLPKAVLASIIMVAVFGLIDVHEVKHLWKVSRSDLALLVLTFFATLTLGIEEGIGLGVGASLLAFVVRTTRPHYAVLGRVPGTEIFRSVKHFDDSEPVPGALLLRFDAQLYFGNISFLRSTVRDEMSKRPDAKVVILDATAMNRLDASAEAALAELHAELNEKGIALIIAGAKYPVTEVMERSGLAARLGETGLPLSVGAAVANLVPPSPVRAVA